MCSCVCDRNIRSLVIISLKKKSRGRQAKGCCTCSKTQSRFQALVICLPSLADEMSVIMATYAHVKLFHGEKTKGEVPMGRQIPPLYKDGESFLEVPRNAFLLESMHASGCTEAETFYMVITCVISPLCHIATPELCPMTVPGMFLWPFQNCVTLPPRTVSHGPQRPVSHCYPSTVPHGPPRTVSLYHPRTLSLGHSRCVTSSHWHCRALSQGTPGLCHIATLNLCHVTLSSSKEAGKAGD